MNAQDYDNWKLDNGESDYDHCEHCEKRCDCNEEMFELGNGWYCEDCHQELLARGFGRDD